jgi:MFS family permease
MTSAVQRGAESARRSTMRFVLLIGVVSMFSDMAHEGARSITGPFMGSLGASAEIVAAVAGFGELMGYGLRFVFGWAADRSGRYWPITLTGYVAQMAAVPLLALAGSWQVAGVLIVAERSGRAMRNPARDAMLSHATGELGRGWVFGVREALDAAGAMVGPLLIALVLYLHGGYRLGFALLLVPAFLTVAVLLGAWRQYPNPSALEVKEGVPSREGIPTAFWIYLVAMGMIALAYADYPLIAYHFSTAHVVPTTWIPILYAAAMATEAVASLGLGRLFDRIGLLTVVLATIFTAAFAPLVFLGNAAFATIGVVCWGLGMAAQESIVKAVITGMVGPARRASAYGLFDTGFGTFWFVGSIALGLLYGWSLTAVVVFSAGFQLLAIPLLVLTMRRLGRTPPPASASPSTGDPGSPARA